MDITTKQGPHISADSRTMKAIVPRYFVEVSPRTAALIAGLGLCLMAVLAEIASFTILQKLVVAGDENATLANIAASSGLFRVGVSCFLVVAVLDVGVAWALYVVLEPVNRGLSLLAAWFRVAYAAVFATALNSLLGILQLLAGAESLKGIEANQVHTQAMLSLSAFRSGWDIGLVLFGFHLLVLSYLVFKSGYMPKWLGVLLCVAALGYLVDSFGRLLSPSYNVSITMFTFVGEVALMFWLLWKGFKGFGKSPAGRLQSAQPQ